MTKPKKVKFTVVPMVGKNKAGEQVNKGWNIKWPDGSIGIPSAAHAGFIVSQADLKDRTIVTAVATIAARRGFHGFKD